MSKASSFCSNVLLQKLDAFDNYLMSHSTNVCYLALLVGMKLDRYLIEQRQFKSAKDAKDLNLLGLGCLLHDVGKMQVPPAILNKPGKLDDAIVKMNTLYFDRGMIRASVTGKTQRNADKVSITFTVEEGPVFTVRRYEITGDMVGDAAAYKKLLSQRSKEAFSPAKLDADMHKLAELDEKRGRKDLLIQPDTHIDDKNNTVDVVLHVVDPKKVQAAPPPPPKPTK